MDFYPTPPDVAQALTDFLKLKSGTTVWEPAAGDGDLAKILRKSGLSVTETDIRTGQDFITSEKVSCDWIITNPPFSIADKFILRCIECQVPFALLLKSQFWHAKSRRDLFFELTPQWILPLTWRPNFNFKQNPRGASLMDVMWVVWRPENRLPPFYMPLKRPSVNVCGNKETGENA